MKFGPVPTIAEQARPWARTLTIGPPPGREDTVGSLDAQVDEQTELGRAFRFFLQLEEGDLEAIQAGHPIEFAVYAHQMVPVSVQVWQVPHESEPNPCGHATTQRGCGGCDPGAVEWVIEDDGTWRKPTPEETSIRDDLVACGVGMDSAEMADAVAAVGVLSGTRDPEICPLSQHVDGPHHTWRFDGDDPYIICHWCDEMRDAKTGLLIRAGRTTEGEQS